jgi:hypothetical protein
LCDITNTHFLAEGDQMRLENGDTCASEIEVHAVTGNDVNVNEIDGVLASENGDNWLFLCAFASL